MKALSRGISFVALALLLITGSASATLAVGDPFDGDSWNQRIYEDLGTTYDHWQMHITSGATLFEIPAFRNFTHGGWTTGSSTPVKVGTKWVADTAWADGPVSNHGDQVTLYFTGASSATFSFTVQTYLGEVLNGTTQAYRTAGKWTFVKDGNTWEQWTTVPEPISMVMLGCLGAGMFVARKLRGKRAA